MSAFSGARWGPGHRIDECGEAIGLTDNDSRVLPEGGFLQLAFQQLRGAAQAAQGIFDLVRELFDHEAAAVEPGEQIVLARDALTLGCVGQLQQQVGSRYLAFERRDSDVQRARVARRPGRPHRQLTISETFAGIEGAAQERR